jgi:hypothetical protein
MAVGVTMAACSSIRLSADFEGGALGRVERVSETRFICHLEGQSDQDGRNRQVTWYYFRLNGAKGREVTITLTDLRGEYNYRPGNAGITDRSPPVVSDDGRTWRHHPSMAFDPQRHEATITIRPRGDVVWIAHIEPYTASRLEAFLREIRGHPDLKDEVIGRSVEGRDLHLLTIGGPASRVVWLMCRQHAWESGTSFVGEGAVRYLLSEEAEPLRRRVVFKVLPMQDPDGCARGGVRFNRNGYDLNRNWDTADPADAESRRLMPEICAAKRAILESGPFDLFLTLHNQETDEWLSGSRAHAALADRFFAALRERTAFDPSAAGPRPPGATPARGRATVYEFLEGELRKPAFILEQGIAAGRKLGRYPTSQDRIEFGRQLARVMGEVVLEK